MTKYTNDAVIMWVQ